MTPFTILSGPITLLDRPNIDTDQIIPARFLRKPRSAGYDNFLFADLRTRENAFPLQPHTVPILVAGANFGCGSSREGAVYALVDAGVRCVIAPSFGDIFAGNAGKNGLLTIELPDAPARLGAATTLAIDLPAQTITLPDGTLIAFEIDAFRKRCLVEGLDDIGLTLVHSDALAAHEAALPPWSAPRAG
ncbi:MAG: 3-isopropylmalate dehydratase small subunit [Alphaproteobacteria bacterium]|nr:3-isopropylmalate dehydratase small subunit [Alphaproteobacteria bacterium]